MLGVSGAPAATVDVTNQSEFDAAIQQAINTGQPNTINVNAPSTIYANTGLVLPGLASPLNLNFNGTPTTGPILGVGSDSTVGSLTIGAGTNLTFTPSAADIARFRVGRDPGGNGTVTMTGGTVTAVESAGQYLTLGVGLWGATGAFNQSGGTVNVAGGSFQVGSNGGQGVYNLSGDGAVLGSGGPIYATTVYIGDSTDSSGGVGALHGVGVLHISGNATFALTAETGGAVWVGNNGGEGTITQDGAGSHVVINGAEVVEFGTNSQYVGAAGTGTYNLINGSLDIADNGAGYGAKFGSLAGGFGYFNQSGGVFTSENSPIIFGSSGVGQYNLSGGTATFAAGLIIAQNAGSTGAVNQTGGILTLSGGQIQFGAGVGAYNLNGGTLQIGGLNPITTGAGAYQFNLGGGTIQVIGSALTTNINATLTAGSTSTIDTNGLGATFSGVLSGTGALAKVGAGTLVLSGVNAYAGGTTISGGVLQATNNSSVGTGAVTLDGGAFQAGADGLAFANNFALTGAVSNTIDTQAYSLTLSGAVSGAGGFTKLGSGVLTLSGAGAYAGATFVDAGTLQAGAVNAFAPASAFTVASGATLDLNSFNQTIGSLSGAGAVTLGAATLTTGGDGTSKTFSGGITGAGGLIKTGAGALILSGDSAYTGPTTVDAGVLDVNGSLASAVTVESGAMLKGDGAVGGLSINNGGVVAPGNSIGTLTVNGAVSFAAGSTYQVEVNAAGQSDKIAATGAATLSGGAVQVLAQPGVYAPQTKYTILTAAGVTGTFAGVASNFAFLTPTLSYDPNDVFLTLSRNATYFSSAAQTPNQRAVATALDFSPFGSALVQAVLPLTAPQAAQAFDALSGEIHASVQTVLFDDSLYMRQAVLGRLRQASFADAIGPMAALSSSGPALAYAEPSPPAPGSSAIASALAAPALAPDTVWWGQGVGAWGRIAADGDAAAVSRDLAGFFTGVDSHFGDNWRAGIASGYTNSSLSSSARASSADIDTVHFAAYALANYLSWNLRTGADFAWSMIGSNRSVQFPGFADYTTARYDAGAAQLFGELGYGVALGNVAAEPFAGLAFVHSNVNGFSETGGVAALTGSGAAGNVGYSTLGARIAASYPLPNGMALTPRVSAAWQHAFGDVTPSAALAFQNTGAAFNVAGAPLAQNAALVEAGLDLAITPQATIGLSYAGQLAGSAQDQSLKGNLAWRF
jgi:outer membrane autotransporter protein